MDPSRAFSRHDVVTGAPPEPDPSLLPLLPDPRPSTAPPSFHLMTKPTGAICNLDCTWRIEVGGAG